MDINKNHFKQALAKHKRQIGIWSNTGSALVAEICAGAGFDWIVLDAEHGPSDVTEILAQHQAVTPYDLEAVVRVPVNDQVVIKRYADAGVRSFLIPFVQSAEEAEAAVSYTRYPPMGVRGVSMGHRANRWGRIKGYHQAAHENMCVLVQIETSEALAELPEILNIEGVDGIFIGPSDLAASMGHLVDNGHSEVQAAISKARALCASAGKAIGILAPVEADARRYFEEGFSFIAVAADSSLVAAGSNASRDRYRDLV